MLEVKNMSVKYGDEPIVNDVSFTLQEGQWMILAGPNGAGKSTIVNAVSKLLPYSGEVYLEGENIKNIKTNDFSKRVSVLSQYHYVQYPFTVREVVSLGRYSHSSGFLKSKKDDEGEAFIDRALEMTGMKSFENKSVLSLSGGELQRVFLAQIFAQNPKLLILDEPTNHLDLIYQKQIFELITEWLKAPGRGVVSVVHDLSLSKAYGTHAVLLNHGKVVKQGKINDVFTKEILNEVYNVDVYAWMNKMYSQWN